MNLIENNTKRENTFFADYACKSVNILRKFKEKNKNNIRTAFSRDVDRIIHSKGYSRYIDKTQVFALFENDHITHRVLHVQFVSKIGRTIGRALRLNEDLIEAIALGHDLGHSPYGHDGERILNNLCQKNNIGFFRHNAQSVRSLSLLEKKGKGVNISLQVLDGILTHNGEICYQKYSPDYNKTWGQFEEEYSNCFDKTSGVSKIRPMTLEGCVVRVSDIIAYIGRDIEDAITLKLIKRSNIPANIAKSLGKTNTKIVNTLVTDLIENSYNKNFLSFSKEIHQALSELKKFNYKYIYTSEKIKTQYSKVVNVFNILFERYCNDINDNNTNSAILAHFLDGMSSQYLEETKVERKTVDFIASMTDNFLNNQFKLMFIPTSLGYEI